MSGPDWTPVVTKGCFTLSIFLVPFTYRGRRGDEKCCAIGTVTPDADAPIDMGFANLDLLGEFCRDMAPRSIEVFNADGSRNADLLEKLKLAADGRLSHIVN